MGWCRQGFMTGREAKFSCSAGWERDYKSRAAGLPVLIMTRARRGSWEGVQEVPGPGNCAECEAMQCCVHKHDVIYPAKLPLPPPLPFEARCRVGATQPYRPSRTRAPRYSRLPRLPREAGARCVVPSTPCPALRLYHGKIISTRSVAPSPMI